MRNIVSKRTKAASLFLSLALVVGLTPSGAVAFAETSHGGGSYETDLAQATEFDEAVNDGAAESAGAVEAPAPDASAAEAITEGAVEGESVPAEGAAEDPTAQSAPASSEVAVPESVTPKARAFVAPQLWSVPVADPLAAPATATIEDAATPLATTPTLGGYSAVAKTYLKDIGTPNGAITYVQDSFGDNSVPGAYTSMVGSYQFNIAGNTVVRGKPDTEQGTPLHSSVDPNAEVEAGYKLAKMTTPAVNVGGELEDPPRTNSSSSVLEAPTNGNTRIVKAFLVVTATQTTSIINAENSPMGTYGAATLKGPQGGMIRCWPSHIFYDSGHQRTSTFFEVTDFAKEQGYGLYTGINIPVTPMTAAPLSGADYFGAWKLIVIEENTDLSVRMLRMRLGGTTVSTATKTEVTISGEGLSVAEHATGELIVSMDGSDYMDSTQNLQYRTSTNGTLTNIGSPLHPADTFYSLNVDRKGKRLLVDPAAKNGNSSVCVNKKTTWPQMNTDLCVMDVNDAGNQSSLKLNGGESSVTLKAYTSNAPTVLSALGLTLDIVAPVFETKLTIANLDQHYSTADVGYENKVGGQYVQTAQEGDTLRATMVCENKSDSKKFIGLQDPVVTMRIGSFKDIDESSLTAYFYPGLYRADSSERPESEGKIILDQVKVTKNDDGTYNIICKSSASEKIQEKGYFEVAFTGTANDSIDYVEYENYAAVEGEYVDEKDSKHDFHMAALGATYTTTASDKPKYQLTVTGVGPGQVQGTGKYYNGDTPTISWEADSDARVTSVFEDSSVRDDLVALSNPDDEAAAASIQAFAARADLANKTTVSMGAESKEVIVVFKADSADDDADEPGQATQDDTCSVKTIADGGVATMTDSGTVAKGSDYAINWSVKPGYRITSVEVDGVAVPFDEGTTSIDFSEIGANHTVKVLTQRVASDGADGTWIVATTISGPGTISPTKAVKAGESYTVDWKALASSEDAVLSLVKVDGEVVYDEYLNNPKTDTANAASKDKLSQAFTNIQGNHSVEVVYRGTKTNDKNTYAADHTVSTAISGGLGTISPSVTVPEDSTTDVSITVTPEGGSEVEGLYLVRGSVRQKLEDGKNGVKITTDADGKVTVTLPRDLIDSDYTVEAALTAPGDGSGEGGSGGPGGTNPGATYEISTAIDGGSGGKITASQIGIAAGESRQIKWEAEEGRHVIAVMVDGHMRDDLLSQGSVTFNDIAADHTVKVYVSEKQTDGPGGGSGEGGSGGDPNDPDNPYNPDGHDPNPVDPTNPNNPGTPGNPGGVNKQPGDENYLYVNVTTVGAGSATPSVSAKVGGAAQVSWAAAWGHKVKSVTVDGIERLDLMQEAARGSLSFEGLMRSHTVVVTFEENPDFDPDRDGPVNPDDPDDVYDPDDPRDDVNVEDPAGYSLVTTKVIGGAGSITGTTYNADGSNRVVTWAPAEGYFVKAVYVDGKEITLEPGQTSYEFADLAGGVHHSVEVRMEPLTPDPGDPDDPDGPNGSDDPNGDDDPTKPEVVIDDRVDIPLTPGGIVTPDDILDFIEEKYGDDPRLPKGEPVVVITKDGEVVDAIDQTKPGTYVIEVTYTDEDGTKRVVRLTYTVGDENGGGAIKKVGPIAQTKGDGKTRLAQTGDELFRSMGSLAAVALLAGAALIAGRRRLRD